MKRVLAASLFVLIAGGCASIQTGIIRDPGKVESITVGEFITKNPVNGELFASYLRSELSARGFEVVDDSPYTLSGTIDFFDIMGLGFGESNLVFDANIVLRKNSKERFVLWFYKDRLFRAFSKTRKEFARYMADEISKTLKE